MAADTKHTPEPWAVEGEDSRFVVGPDNRSIYGALARKPDDESEANARRIVACVNACAGIPTEALEAGALGEALRLAVEFIKDTRRPGRGPAMDALAKLGVKP